MASNIPKFASFRPKPKPDNELPPKERRDRAEISSKERAQSIRAQSSSTKNQHTKEHLPSKAYFSDRRGDPQILRYTSLSSYDIPAYRRYGHGCILGLPVHQKIDREYSTDKKVYVTPETRRRQERLLTSKQAKRSSNRGLRLVEPSLQQPDVGKDFISLSISRERSSSKGSDADEPELDYRGFDQRRGVDKTIDPDLEYDTDSPVRHIDTAVTVENSRLLRRTREHPDDVEAWLASIYHQEAMLKLGRPLDELSTADKAHLALIRIPMYEEALKKVNQNEQGKLRLYQGLLREGRRAWDETKVSIKWQEVIAKHQGNAELWFMYLDFVQSNFPGFKYDDCCELYSSCLDALTNARDGISPETILHILLRLTSMMQEAGYQELALATWQAILELHVMRPSNNDSDRSETLAFFEQFWESEVPRVGEVGAKGWRSAGGDEPPSPNSSLLDKPDTLGSGIKHFGKYEMEAIANLRHSGRTADEGEWDDAFHIIFFSDLRAVLLKVPTSTSRVLIVEAFLCFCGLPPPAHLGLQGPKWWSDPFLQHRFLLETDFRRDLDQFKQTFLNLSCRLSLGFQMTPELLFKQEFSLSSIRLGPDFIRRLLKLIASDSSGIDWIGEYLLAFELQHFSQYLNKTAKQLIKADPSNLRLYNAYGLAESHRGNSTQADQVFSMALSMHSGAKNSLTTASLELFSNWVWQSLDQGGQAETLWRITSPHSNIPDRNKQDERPESSTLNGARTILSATIERDLLNQNYISAITSTTLVALLDYLSNDYQLTEALSTHQNLSSWFASHKLSQSPYAELHAQAIARLLTHYITHAPIVKPAVVRLALVPLISIFPENTVLLALYAANESRFSLDDRVRSIMKQTTLQATDSTSIFGWAFAIHFETLRGEISGSTAHSVRALYKRATDSACAYSPAFWKCYVRFELAQLQLEQSRWRLHDGSKKHRTKIKRDDNIKEAAQRVKDTFYAGLRNLPWCKDFVMLAFSELQDVIEEEDLWKLYHVMQEKELRLYIEFDKKDT